MIVKLEENLAQKDIEVLIKYARMSPTVKRLTSLLKSVDTNVKCSLESKETWMNASEIYYIESVDKRTFVYGNQTVYRSEQRLYQLIEQLSDVGFVQVSKSCIINVNMLESIQPLRNSRMQATLSNQERIDVTRKFIPSIRKKLEER